MNTPLRIGLTGGIGCGKSSAAKILESFGFARLDTDQAARDVVQPNSEGLRRVVEEFGDSVLHGDGTLDRNRLAARVFANLGDRKKLESILHPLIWEKVDDFHSRCEKTGSRSVVEVPLLFENNRQGNFDEIWVVSVSREKQFERLRNRNCWSDEEIESRLVSQMPLSEKVARASVVLENSGTVDDLRDVIAEALQILEQRETDGT